MNQSCALPKLDGSGIDVGGSPLGFDIHADWSHDSSWTGSHDDSNWSSGYDD